jgi:hypothetical protein
VLRQKPPADIAKDRLTETLQTTRDVLAPRLTAARVAVSPYVDEASARVAPYVDEARQRLTPAVERLAPAVDTARTRLRTDVVPAVVAAAETARETSAPARAEAKERAAGALLALRGEKVTKGRRWPAAVACLLFGAAAGAAVGMSRRPTQPAPLAPTPTPFPQTPPTGSVDGAPTTTARTTPPGAS